jgi:TRAP-type C4-dicarboxylate transport system substrate-binding protein
MRLANTLLTCFILSAGSALAQTTITLNAVGIAPINDPTIQPTQGWMKDVAAATNGRVSVRWKGGPDVIAANDQFDAVVNGVVEAGFNVAGYYDNRAPELRAFNLSQNLPWEERQNGFYDFMVQRHEKLGVRYLGRWLNNNPFYIFLKKPVQRIGDLKGVKLRGAGTLYVPFMRALDTTPVNIPIPEIYTSLERGVVDGFAHPALGFRAHGWHKLAKYIVDHPVWAPNATILVNLKAWNAMPKNLQAAVIKATADWERKDYRDLGALRDKEWKEIQSEGVTLIKLPPDDARRYRQLSIDVQWQYLESRVPDLVPQLKKLTAK